MFDRKFIDLIEIFQYVHIHTTNMKSGNKRRESVIKQNMRNKQNVTTTINALFDTYKSDTITELMNNPSNKLFIIYYQNWYNNF
jgi:hypothetical protein